MTNDAACVGRTLLEKDRLESGFVRLIVQRLRAYECWKGEEPQRHEQNVLRDTSAVMLFGTAPDAQSALHHLGIARVSVESSGSGLTHFTMPFCGSQELTYQGRPHPAL